MFEAPVHYPALLDDAMPGSMPATTQLDWLIAMTAMIVLFWSRATRDLLKSFGWGIAGTPSIRGSDEVAIPRRPPHSVSRDRPIPVLSGSIALRACWRGWSSSASWRDADIGGWSAMIYPPLLCREAIAMANATRLLIKN